MAFVFGRTGNYVERDIKETLEISSGVVAVLGSGRKILQAESGTEDQLDQVTGLADGKIIVLEADAGDTITVPDSANIKLAYELECVLSGDITLTLIGEGNDVCKEISRTY
jgi:hypothetical protein